MPDGATGAPPLTWTRASLFGTWRPTSTSISPRLLQHVYPKLGDHACRGGEGDIQLHGVPACHQTRYAAGPCSRGMYVQACKELSLAWYIFLADQSSPEIASPKKWRHKLKGLLHHDGPNGSRILERGQLAGSMHSTYLSDYGGEWRYSPTGSESPGTCAYRRADEHACELAAELLGMESSMLGLMEVIFEVWVEMLCYAALHSSLDSHARQLSSGGEFITVVWLLIHHLGKPE
uniref:DUF4220 domain-containing protein n=2 Tax=Aegilops tauschii subsp. strangulata TaxID=200361 RepID=A0A452ZUA8_AEGTS